LDHCRPEFSEDLYLKGIAVAHETSIDVAHGEAPSDEMAIATGGYESNILSVLQDWFVSIRIGVAGIDKKIDPPSFRPYRSLLHNGRLTDKIVWFVDRY
jgi:hypothetical protein